MLLACRNRLKENLLAEIFVAVSEHVVDRKKVHDAPPQIGAMQVGNTINVVLAAGIALDGDVEKQLHRIAPAVEGAVGNRIGLVVVDGCVRPFFIYRLARDGAA